MRKLPPAPGAALCCSVKPLSDVNASPRLPMGSYNIEHKSAVTGLNTIQGEHCTWLSLRSFPAAHQHKLGMPQSLMKEELSEWLFLDTDVSEIIKLKGHTEALRPCLGCRAGKFCSASPSVRTGRQHKSSPFLPHLPVTFPWEKLSGKSKVNLIWVWSQDITYTLGHIPGPCGVTF